ncbi:MAG: hypothetical protein QXG98_00905 [Candidatus Micrarchaeia archaeon]
MRKKKIKLSPRQIADIVNRALLEDSLALAATQRGIGGVIETSEVEERMRKLDESLAAQPKARRSAKRAAKK